MTDASNLAVGGVLEQRGTLGWEPLAFYSSKLKPNEQMWPPYNRELLGAFKGIHHFRDMIEGRAFTLYTDHQSLIPSLSKKTDSHTARQIYQLSCKSEYTTDIRYVKGKANLVADALSRPNEELSDIHTVSQQLQEATSQTSPDSSTTSCPDLNNSPPQFQTATTSRTPLPYTLTYASAASSTASSSERPSCSSTKEASKRALEARQEAAIADFNCVVASIGDMS